MISPSDPQSAWTAKANKRVQFGYGLNYLIDIENAVIVDVEATPARTYDEVAATQTMLDRTQERFGLKPKRLAADTAYGTGKFLGWLVKVKKIIPHIPVWERSDRQDGIFSRSDFRWDKKRGVYICPSGKLLRTSGTVHEGRTLLYRASKRDCDVCPLRASRRHRAEPQDARAPNPRATTGADGCVGRVGGGGGVRLNAAAQRLAATIKAASSETMIESKPFSTASTRLGH